MTKQATSTIISRKEFNQLLKTKKPNIHFHYKRNEVFTALWGVKGIIKAEIVAKVIITVDNTEYHSITNNE